MDPRDRYAKFCQEVPDLPVFMEPWYLDALAPDWQVVLAERGGEVVAAWPYYPKRKGPIQYVTMPLLVRMMGPVFRPDADADKHRYKLIPQLWEKMPRHLIFRQDAPYSLTNWLPLYWLGFRQYTRYSYRIDLSQGEQSIWEAMAADYRQHKIPKAKAQVNVERSDDLLAFHTVHEATFKRQGKPCPVPLATLQRLDEVAKKVGRREIFLARDQETGQVHAGLYLIRDHHSVYLLMAGSDPELRASGAVILLTWEAILWSLQQPGVKYFDFMGSMIEPIERVRRQFGAEQIPFFRIGHLKWAWLGLLMGGRV
ncbi:MAG: GNAT family N-acetyltransferase [Saprospiraceae bacterium]|nr:GNAT family N-acetyltransferase [Saprospiraceae bacterium]